MRWTTTRLILKLTPWPPILIDSYHNQDGYIGSRKGVQLVLLNHADGGDRLIHA
jgi:hypothetical protein